MSEFLHGCLFDCNKGPRLSDGGLADHDLCDGLLLFAGILSENSSSLIANYEILLPLKAFSSRRISLRTSFWLHYLRASGMSGYDESDVFFRKNWSVMCTLLSGAAHNSNAIHQLVQIF